jgi:hypothetical protein
MRRHFFTTGILIASAMLIAVTGCGEKKSGEKPADNSTTTTNNVKVRELFPQEKVVQQFINATAKRDREAAFALLTPTAQQAYSKDGFSLDQNFQDTQCQITGSQPITQGDDSHYGVFVTIFGKDNGETYQFDTVWGVRKNGNEYRIAGLVIKDEDLGEIALDFEKPAQSRETLNQAMSQESAGHPAATANTATPSNAAAPTITSPLQTPIVQPNPNPPQHPAPPAGEIAQPGSQSVR